MLYKKKNRIQLVWMLFTMLSLTIGASVVKTEEFAVQAGTRAEWEINSVSDQAVAWYRIDVWTYLGSWKAQSGSKLVYTITDVKQDVYGDLVIGNLTITNSSSAEIASALVLGILSWGPGLITHTDWVKHTEDAQEQTRSEWINGTLEITETTQKYMDKTFETIRFDMVSASQNTALVYDKTSGFLLEAQTGFGQYFLDIEISSTDPPLKAVGGQFLALTWEVVLVPFLFLAGFGIWRRRKSTDL